jgi:hypothetical protein
VRTLLIGGRRYAFIEFKNADDAHFAMQAMDHFAFDKRHTFLINKFTDVEYYADMDETYEDPDREEYQAKVNLLDRKSIPTNGVVCRNISRHGSQTRRGGISMRSTAEKSWQSTGMESRRSAKRPTQDQYGPI